MYNLAQSFYKTFIVSIRSKFTTELCREVLDNRMSDGPTTIADDILKNLSDVYLQGKHGETDGSASRGGSRRRYCTRQE